MSLRNHLPVTVIATVTAAIVASVTLHAPSKEPDIVPGPAAPSLNASSAHRSDCAPAEGLYDANALPTMGCERLYERGRLPGCGDDRQRALVLRGGPLELIIAHCALDPKAEHKVTKLTP